MKTTRKTLGVLAIGLGASGMLAACAPPTPPTPTVPGPVTSSKTMNLTCSLDIYSGGSFLFTSSKTYNGTVVTLTAPSSVPTGTPAAYTATVTGIVNGPLPQASGTANVITAPGGDSATGVLGAVAANAPLTIPTLSGSSGNLAAATPLKVTGVKFHGQGNAVGDWANGTCSIPAADQPTVNVGVS